MINPNFFFKERISWRKGKKAKNIKRHTRDLLTMYIIQSVTEIAKTYN